MKLFMWFLMELVHVTSGNYGFYGKGDLIANPQDEGSTHEVTSGSVPFFASPKSTFTGTHVKPPLVERQALQTILSRWNKKASAVTVARCAQDPCRVEQPSAGCNGYAGKKDSMLIINCDSAAPHSITSIGYATEMGRDGRTPARQLRLAGSIPPELGQLTELRSLEIANTDLGGTLPKELAKLTKLEQFRIPHNKFTGTIPAWIGKLTSLRDLQLSVNYFQGTLPDSLGDLNNLIRFKAFENFAFTPLEVKMKKLKGKHFRKTICIG